MRPTQPAPMRAPLDMPKKATAKRKPGAAATRKKRAKRATKPKPTKRAAAKKEGGTAAVSVAKKKRRPGRPAFKPTDEQREMVLRLIGLGMKHEQIVTLIDNPQTGKPITEVTFRRHFEKEIRSGIANVYDQVANSLVGRAIDKSHPQGAICAIFLAKTRMGFREKVEVAVESKSGVLIPPAAITPEDWVKMVGTRNAEATEPGNGGASDE